MITIKGSIPNISQAEAEVSSKLRAAYETDLNAMTPHSMMFPGLHPTAMMSTVGISNNYRAGPAPLPPQWDLELDLQLEGPDLSPGLLEVRRALCEEWRVLE